MPKAAILRIFSILASSWLALWLPGPVAASDAAYAWLEVTLNKEPKGMVLAAFPGKPTQAWLKSEDLQTWGLLEHAGHVVRIIEDMDYSALHSVQGLQVNYDPTLMSLDLRFDSARLPWRDLQLQQHSNKAAEIQRGHGWHLNYDALVTGLNGDSSVATAAFIEPVYFSAPGTLRTGLRWLNDSSNSGEVLRLDSLWTTDWVTRRARLNLGDFISAPDSFGTSSRIGGIQLKREFSITPEALTFATPTLFGVADVPSNVELFINGVRRASMSTQPGPFSIQNAPIMTGAGSAELVLTNALGEQIIQSVDYYVDPALLRDGLFDYNLALGWQRENYALSSFDYAKPQAIGELRYGVNDKATIEGRGKLSESASNFDLRYLFQVLNWPLTVTTGLGFYQLADGVRGPTSRLGFSWRHPRYFAGLQAVNARTPPAPQEALPLTRQILGRAGLRIQDWSLSYDALYRRKNATDRFTRQGLRASRNLRFRTGNLGLSASLFLSDDTQSGRDGGVTLSLSWSPDHRQHFSVSDRQANEHQFLSSYQYRSGRELGEQIQLYNIHEGERDSWVAQLSTRQTHWQGRGRLQLQNEQESLQLGVQGALGRMHGHWFTSRALGSSYAMIDLNGHQDVPLSLHNRVMTKTNQHGIAIIPYLLPYQDNLIHLDTLDLPLESQLKSENLQVRPGANTGLYLDIPVKQRRAAQLRLMHQPLRPVPAGAVIYSDDQQERFFVGSNGETYVELEQAKTRFQAYWQDQECHFTLTQARIPEEVLPHIGDVPCL